MADGRPVIRLMAGLGAVVCLSGCAPNSPWVGVLGDLPPASVLVMEARIVDIDPEGGNLTVKEAERYETWTVAVVETTQIRDIDGGFVEITKLQIGDRIEIRGTSRIGRLVTAHEISILDDRPERRQGIGQRR